MDEVGPGPGPAGTRPGRLRQAAAFVRLSALGGTWGLVAAGGLSADAVPDAGELAALALIGLGFHVFAYVGNDVADLEVDRTEPRRAASPLVLGTVSRRAAAVVAAAGGGLALAAVAVVVAAAGGGPTLPGVGTPDGRGPVPAAGSGAGRGGAAGAEAVLAGRPEPGVVAVVAVVAALAGLAAYNRWGKRCRWPAATDLVQALGWAALVVGAALVAGRATALTAWLAAFTVAFILLANGVHGALRDLANDRRCGVRSTAIVAGATVGPGGRPLVPAGLRRYALVLHWLAAACVAAGIAGAPCGLPARAAALAAVAAVAAGGHRLLAAAAGSGDLEGARAAGMTHLVLLLGLPLVAVAPRLAPAGAAAVAAAYLAPLAAHGWLPAVARWAWRSRVAAPVRLTRAPNAAVAGLASVLGSYLGGGAAAAGSGPARLGALAVALVVAFGNALNDLADVDVDRLRRPERPLPAGRMTRRAARAVAGASAAGALVAAAGLPPAAAAVVVANLALSALYCLRLKGTVLAGNLVVAILCASTLPFGAAVAGGRLAPALLGATMVFAFMVPYEVLKDLDDRETDGAAGLRTVATALGPGVALRIARALPAALAAVLAAGWWLGLAPPAYLAAAVPASLLPALAAVALVRGEAPPAAVRAAVRLLKAGWLTGLAAMLLLR